MKQMKDSEMTIRMKYLTKSILQMKKRNPDAIKGFFGKTLLVGGSEDYVGAPAMAALAAEAVLRSGADLVAVAAPSKVSWAINYLIPDVITRKIPCKRFSIKHAKRIISMAEDYDVVLIGPGLGRDRSTLAFAREVCSRIKKPKVIDADALKAVKLDEIENAILTPHRKELEILLKNSGLKEKELKKRIGSNVILKKGRVDTIVSGSRTAFNRTGNAVMTKGGTGDVLAGLCAGFLAQGDDLFTAACRAAYLNGKVGDYLLKKKGRTFIASDLVNNIEKVYR